MTPGAHLTKAAYNLHPLQIYLVKHPDSELRPAQTLAPR